MNTSNLKDTVTTICAITTGFCGTLIGGLLIAGVAIPVWLIIGVVALGTLATTISQVLTGKTPSGETKSMTAVIEDNKSAVNAAKSVEAK